MLEWSTKRVRISDLKDYEHNPRKITKKEMEKLIRSLREDGYHQRIIVDHDLTIIGGHQRKKAMLKAGFSLEDEVEVLTPSRELAPEELDRINIRDNLPFGEYDFEVLANRFEVETLVEWGMPEEWLLGKNDIEEESSVSQEGRDNKCICTCCHH
jgi:site-specific DNA-methyltransferase (adenine-specific)